MTDLVWEDKVWGRVAQIPHPVVSLSILETKGMTRCSVHRHRNRWNHFRVIVGSLRILHFNANDISVARAQNRDYSTLVPEKIITAVGYELAQVDHCIPPGQWHAFEVLGAGVVVESYWNTDRSPPDINDIERFDVGGVIQDFKRTKDGR